MRFPITIIITFQENEDKILQLDSNKIIGISGETADRMQFGDFIQKNIQLYKFRNSIKLGVKETATWIRSISIFNALGIQFTDHIIAPKKLIFFFSKNCSKKYFHRSEVAEALRKGPYQANSLIAGYDEDGPALYWLDYLGTLQRVTKGAHGLEILLRCYHAQLSLYL